MGLPVTDRTDNAAPPRVSASTLVKMTPVSGNVSPKALAVITASCPIMASTTNSVSMGLTAAWSSRISAIMASSTASRPAVSTSRTSVKLSRAFSRARFTMATGFSSTEEGSKRAPTSDAKVSSCLIAAGRYTSADTTATDFFSRSIK